MTQRYKLLDFEHNVEIELDKLADTTAVLSVHIAGTVYEGSYDPRESSDVDYFGWNDCQWDVVKCVYESDVLGEIIRTEDTTLNNNKAKFLEELQKFCSKDVWSMIDHAVNGAISEKMEE